MIINKLERNEIIISDSSSLDSFSRLRVSNPVTVFNSKLLFNKSTQLWDEALESGGGISSSHSVNEAAVTITSTANTAGKFTRQTFMRFNYQPGKSQLILMSGILSGSVDGDGVVRRIGLFDDNNGIFFENNSGIVGITRRTNVSGSPVDNNVSQSNWNLDSMDGKGPSGISVDWTKTQIFLIDFEWLGVGRVRVGLNIDGSVFYVHQFLNSNVLSTVYMSTPNLPLRYQMITTGDSPVSTMKAICTSVSSEGGVDANGHLHYFSTSGTHIEANSADTVYVIVGIRLKTSGIGAGIFLEQISLINEAGDDYEWFLVLNPTLANGITFSDISNSPVQIGVGNAGSPSNSTVTGGDQMDGGFVKSGGTSGSIIRSVKNAILLGSAIDGTRDEIYLCVRPLTNGANIQGSITWRELS